MEGLAVWFQWVLKSSILVIPVILFVLLLRNGMKRISGFLTYVLWLVVWLRLICPVGIPSELRLSTVPDAAIQTIEGWFDKAERAQEALVAQDKESVRLAYQNGQWKSGKEGSNVSGNEGFSGNRAGGDTEFTEGTSARGNTVNVVGTDSSSWNYSKGMKMLCAVWFIGMALAFLHEFVRAFYFHRKLRFAVKQEKGVYCCSGISSAFVTGIFRGRVYLPFGTKEREKAIILEHEKAHIRHRDYLVKKLCFAVCLIYWFHPLVWLAYYFLCYDMEIACDEAVLRKMNPRQRKQYSYALLSSAVKEEYRIPFYQPQFGKNMVKGRIWHSIHYKEEKLEFVLVGVFVVALAAILCMTVRPDKEIVPMQKGGNYTKEVEKLYKNKVKDSTDQKAVKKLLSAVISKDFLDSYDETVTPFTCEVQADVLQIDLAMWISRPDSFRKLSGDYSAIFLALIPDVKRVQWRYEEIQYGGTTETVHLHYDWPMMQKEDFVDASVCGVTKSAEAGDFGASASSLQQLINSFTYYEKGKIQVEAEALAVFDEEQMKKELRDLPRAYKRSYKESIKCKEIYVSQLGYYSTDAEKGADLIRKEYRKKLWDEFCEKAEKGEAASVIIAGYNSLEDAKIEENGSVSYTYLCFDGVRYYALYDFVGKDRKDSFEMVSGKYLLYSESNINDTPMGDYYITDDASLSSRDRMYAAFYGGMTEYVSMAVPELYVVKTVFL